ncbi:Heterogeneous nuclear ribonucleoprotein U protein 1 [Spatholobus suberectus]|nr:Heterogeneous nuclear ribonucleoprotein U protein 1 [Spatholobus suberectus]
MVMGPIFTDPRDCEVIMMVGLPASGKTTWAEKWVKDHPEKRYVLLGTNLILDQMRVPGLLRRNNYGERFDLLMDRATGIFNILLSRAANIPRNYIIDQTNVYKNARKRKLKPFADYQKIAVVVFPKPEELKIRSDKRFTEMGKEVPPDAVNKMIGVINFFFLFLYLLSAGFKFIISLNLQSSYGLFILIMAVAANYVLPKSKDMPHSDEYFDQVMFVELNQGESQKYLDQMKQNLVYI